MKNKFSILFTAIVVFCTVTVGYSQNSSYEIATWEGFRTAAVTFTFDDGCPNQFSAAVPIFNKYEYKATFFIPIQMNNPNWNTLRNLANNGYEIGNHSVTHPGTVTESEISSAKNTINQNIPGFDCNTIAYPNCNVPNPESMVAKYCIGGRVCDGQVVNKTPSNYYRIGSIICGNQGSCNSLANFQTQLNTAKNKNGWAVFLIHEVNNGNGYSPLQASVIESTLGYIKQNDGDFWVTTFRNAILYSKERDAAKINELTNTANEITLTLTDNLDNAVYNYPLSIRRATPAGWTNVTATQGGKTIEASIKSGYIYFSAVPGAGTIVLTPGTPISGFTLTTSVSPAAGGTITGNPNPSSGRYDEGANVTLTAVAAEGWAFDGWSGDAAGSQAAVSVKMDKNKTVAAKFILVGDGTENLVRNGNFANTQLWTLNTGSNYGGSAGTYTPTNNQAVINITATGTNPWEPQLIQSGIALDKGMKYRLTFTASADAPRQMEVLLQMASSPYTDYLKAGGSFDLTTQPKTFMFEFEMTDPSDINAQLAFNVGHSTIRVNISDVQLVYIAKFTESGDPTETSGISSGTNLRVNVLPNSTVNVTFTAQGTGETELKLYSLNGNLLASTKLQTFAGKSYSYTFNQGKLPGGLYIVWMRGNGGVEQAKVLM